MSDQATPLTSGITQARVTQPPERIRCSCPGSAPGRRADVAWSPESVTLRTSSIASRRAAPLASAELPLQPLLTLLPMIPDGRHAVPGQPRTGPRHSGGATRFHPLSFVRSGFHRLSPPPRSFLWLMKCLTDTVSTVKRGGFGGATGPPHTARLKACVPPEGLRCHDFAMIRAPGQAHARHAHPGRVHPWPGSLGARAVALMGRPSALPTGEAYLALRGGQVWQFHAMRRGVSVYPSHWKGEIPPRCEGAPIQRRGRPRFALMPRRSRTRRPAGRRPRTSHRPRVARRRRRGRRRPARRRS